MDAYSDEVDVRVLEETLSKVGNLTEKITISLRNVSRSSSRAEKNIKPISGRTRELAIYGENLDNSLHVISEIRGYAEASAKADLTIQAGPANIGVDPYIDTVRNMEDLLSKLQNSHLRSFHKVVSKIDQLVKQGKASLRDYFSHLLSSTYTPIDINPYIKQGQPMPNASEETTVTLRKLFTYFEQSKTRMDGVYVEAVSQYIINSLAPLGSTVLPKKPSKTPYEKGSSTLHVYTAALKGLLYSQLHDLKALFADSPMKASLYEQVCSTSISEYVALVGRLNDHVHKNMGTDSLLIFEAIECTGQLITSVQETSRSVPPKLSETMQKVQATAHSVFTEFIRYTDSRIQNLQTIPSDNGVCEASVDIMSRMGRLAEYKTPALVAISTMAPSAWIPSPAPAWAQHLPPSNTTMMGDPLELLASFFSDSIDALLLGLESKARVFGKKNPQIGYFILTNLLLIEGYVMQKDIYKILGESGADRIERLKKRGLNLFLEGWKMTAQRLMDVTVTKPGSDKLSSKDREAIKEKFRLFNAEFEELVKRHKAYNIKDKNLKEMLVKEIQFISPLYHRFHDKHAGGDFSKNVDKYIKYSNADFDRIIESLG
ncbi:exocyst complex component Exo70p [Trichomonascus vanleenenianus]|uniref:GTP-Rho binding exocyst subunit EXO70 n=1 Tax=Trichomonascus vanleenenianus TaxID=2268995 RepID=UPI003ECB32BD